MINKMFGVGNHKTYYTVPEDHQKDNHVLTKLKEIWTCTTWTF